RGDLEQLLLALSCARKRIRANRLSSSRSMPLAASSHGVSLAFPKLPKTRWIVTGLCTVFFCGGCQKANDLSNFGSPPPAASAYFKTHWQDESQFIAEMIGIDLSEMTFFAKHESLPGAKEFSVRAVELNTSTFRAPQYQFQIALEKAIPPLRTDVKVDRPIWEPSVYDPLVIGLLKAVGLARETGSHALR